MSTIANQLTVTPEADAYIDEIGMRGTYERMLKHIPEHYQGLQSIAVTLGLDYEEGGPPTVLFEVMRDDPGEYDGADGHWDRWVIENFHPDQFRHFVVLSFRT
ncbi:MAG TPA: hypothetical protein VE988_20115 [Gemmataceae bacterium]|nr:hypothetical protein [Gemmataceae bacterium]